MPALFEETTLKGMRLPNRLVRSATFEGMADETGLPSEALTQLYQRLARGGVGLIITGYAYVSADGRCSYPGMAAIDRDEVIPAHRALVDAVHDLNVPICLQIAHCGRQTRTEWIGQRPLAPSAVMEKPLGVELQVMSEEDIERVIEAFGQAARRAKEAGYDAVQLHGAHGYLINQFLSPYTNRRTDGWGGSLANRMRFVGRILQRCRDLVGEDYPILIKLNASDAMRRGLKLEESVAMAEQLARLGVDGIEVSCGIGEDGLSTFRGDVPLAMILDEWPEYRRLFFLFRWLLRLFGRFLVRPPPMTQAFNRAAAAAIKAKVDVPVFVVGGITEPATMEAIVASGDADYVSLSRALLANPKLPNQIRDGSREPSTCRHCNLCIGSLPSRPLRCYSGKRPKALPAGTAPRERQLPP